MKTLRGRAVLLLIILTGAVRAPLLVLLLVAGAATAQTPQPPTSTDLVNQLQAVLDRLRTSVFVAPIPDVAPIATPAELDAALAAGLPVITLSPTLVYPAALSLRSSVTLQVVDLRAGRMDLTTPLPSFRAGVTITGDGVRIIGAEVRQATPLRDLVVVTGSHVVLDRLRVLGDPIAGAKRCIAANGPDLTIARSYAEDCFAAYPGADSQAILAWDTPGPLLILDNYLSGGSETIMLGGGDPSSPANIPSDVTIRGNTITARPEWQALKVGVKSRLELKNARRVLIEDNVVEYVWGGHGQDGFLFSATVRNQDGGVPESTIEDVVVRRNVFRHGASAINLLATDAPRQPSQRMARVTFLANIFEDLDWVKYTGSSKLIQIGLGPIDLTIDQNTFVAVSKPSSTVYFYGTPPLTGFTLTNNTWSPSKYGIFGDGASTAIGKAWAQYVATGTQSGNATW